MRLSEFDLEIGGNVFNDTFKYVKLENLSDKEKNELTKVLVKQREALAAMLKATDEKLAAVGAKPKGKRMATRRAARPTTKR
jgi:hypothetical protein